MDNERKSLLRKMLEQIDPEASSGGFRESLESAHGGAESELEVHRPDPMAAAEGEMALESLDVLRRGDELSDDNQFALEAIVMPFHRPVIDIVGDKLAVPQLSAKWKHLGTGKVRSRIERTVLSIGRLEIPGHPSLPYAGTGFVVGQLDNNRSLLMTNRHVASLFARGLGDKNLDFVSGQDVYIDFKQEFDNPATDSLKVQRVAMIHPYWDMALLEVSGLAASRKPLQLMTDVPEDLAGREVVVVGYPGYDPNPDMVFQQTQARIFRNQYYVKRLQPGLLRKRDRVRSYEHTVDAITHDCSTLGGNSGSAVIDVATGNVVALHFAGAYLRANFAVPAHDLAEDSRVVDAGVDFTGCVAADNEFYKNHWSIADQESVSASSSSEPKQSTPRAQLQSPPPQTLPISVAQHGNTPTPSSTAATITIPLHITVSIGDTETPPNVVATHIQPSTSSQSPASEGLFGSPSLSVADAAEMFTPSSLRANAFDWAAALSLAVASKLAYSDSAEVVSVAESEMEFDKCEFLESEDTQCFVATNADTALVSFRGTESLRDWLSDLNVISTRRDYGRVHRGFVDAFEVIRPDLQAALAGLGARAVVLTGHSLGAALATVAAAEWATQFDIRSIYTYGQPATGKGDFRSFIGRHFGGKMFRIVNDDDIVTRVPPTYEHVGQLKHLGANGRLKAVEESLGERHPVMSQAEFDMLRAQFLQQRAIEAQHPQVESAFTPVTEGLLPSFSDHKIDNYILKIAKNA